MKPIKFSDLNAIPPSSYLKALEDGHREAMQGLCCALGRLQAIPVPEAQALSSPFRGDDGVGADDIRPQATSRMDVLQARVAALIAFLDEVTHQWAQEEIHAELAFRDAAIEEALKSMTAQAAADAAIEAHESYFAY